jgi:hypothetical protein
MSATTPASPTPASLPPLWHGLIDDAAIFPPGDASLDDAITAWQERLATPYAGLARSFVVRDTDLGGHLAGIPLTVVCTIGAGAVEPAVELAHRKGLTLAGIEVALRGPDLAGNARRVEAAVRTSGLDDDVPIHLEITGPMGGGWLAAADEVAAAGHSLKLRLGNVDHDLIPDAATVAGWIDAALDRETPFKATAGLHRAVRHDAEGGGAHGFLNVLVATRALLDGASRDEAVDVLESRDGAALAAHELGQTRRWFTSFGSCSVTEPRDDLIALGLLEGPGLLEDRR